MATKIKSFKVHSHGRSDIGFVRDNNEDAWLVEPQNNVYVLCDGMGGHSAGEVASQEAISTFAILVKNYLNKNKSADLIREHQIFKELIQRVNTSVYELAQKDRDLRGMGTTFCCVYFQKKSMVVAHVGDSRIYLLRNKKLVQLTEDHSLVSELLELGELNSRQAREYAYRNIITRAIGVEAEVDPAIQVCNLVHKDQVLMCSDGLSDLLDLQEIESILNMNESLEHSIDQLINTALSKGGHDNTTAVLMKVLETNE